jgi:hypothetical protein
MLHQRNLPHGQGRPIGNRSYEARKGMKIMAIADRVMDRRSRSARTRRTITKSVWCGYVRLLLIEAKPKNLIGDRAYDSDPRPHRATEGSRPRQIGEGIHATLARWPQTEMRAR